MKQPVREK